MGLEQDILDDISKQISDEVDFHVMADLLETIGWVSVKLKRFRDGIEAVDINLWVEANCTGEWKNLSTRYIFEKKQDAEWFILRWQ
jgi:hypothetical protein